MPQKETKKGEAGKLKNQPGNQMPNTPERKERVRGQGQEPSRRKERKSAR